MFKTYNLVRRHLGDQLTEIVVSYITPKHLCWSEIVESGSGELVAMIHPEDRHVAYMHLMGDGESELADIVLNLDDSNTIFDVDISLYAQSGINNELVRAVHASDLKRVIAAIRSGARNFDDVYAEAGKPYLDNDIGRLIASCYGKARFGCPETTEKELEHFLKKYERKHVHFVE